LTNVRSLDNMVEKTSPNTGRVVTTKARGFSFGGLIKGYSPPLIESPKMQDVINSPNMDQFEEMKWDLEESKKQLKVHMMQQLELDTQLKSLQKETSALRINLAEQSEKADGELSGLKERYQAEQEQMQGQIAHKMMEIIALEAKLNNRQSETESGQKRIQAQKEKIALIQKKLDFYQQRSVEDQRVISRHENKINHLTAVQKDFTEQLEKCHVTLEEYATSRDEGQNVVRQKDIEIAELTSQLNLQLQKSEMLRKQMKTGGNSDSAVPFSSEERDQLLNRQDVLELELKVRSDLRVQLERQMQEMEAKMSTEIREIKRQLEAEKTKTRQTEESMQEISQRFENQIRRKEEDCREQILAEEIRVQSDLDNMLRCREMEIEAKHKKEEKVWSNEKSQLQAQIARLEAAIADHDQNLQKERDSNSELQEQIKQKDELSIEYQTKITHLQSENKRLTSAVDLLDKAFGEEIMIKDEQLAAYAEERKDLEKQIADLDTKLKQSMSSSNSSQRLGTRARSHTEAHIHVTSIERDRATETSRRDKGTLTRSASSIAAQFIEGTRDSRQEALTSNGPVTGGSTKNASLYRAKSTHAVSRK